MDIASSTSATLPNALANSQAAPAYVPPAASKKAPDAVNERKEPERSDHDNDAHRDAKPREQKGQLASHLGQSLDIAL